MVHMWCRRPSSLFPWLYGVALKIATGLVSWWNFIFDVAALLLYVRRMIPISQ